MKRILIAFLAVLFMLSGCSEAAKYKRINIRTQTLASGETALSQTVNSATRVEMNATETFSETMPVLEIKPREITETEIRELAAYFDVEIGDDIRNCTDGYCTDYSTYWFMVDGNCVSYDTDDSDRPLLKKDEELIEEAKRIMSELPIIEGEYECLGVLSTQTLTNANDETYIVKKRVAFYRLVEGVRVLGDEYCNLYFDADGLCTLNMELYDYEKTGEIEMLSLDDALDKVKKPDAFSIGSESSAELNGKADTLCVERVKLLFVNQYSDGCTILQPVFNMIGTATNENGSVEFSSKIIAIPDKYTYEE